MQLVDNRLRKGMFATIIILVGTLTSGCSARPENTQGIGWVEPGWMAAHRQEVEVHTVQMVDCLAERGIIGIVGIGGPVALAGNAGVHDLPGMQETRDAAQTECIEIVGRPQAWSLDRSESLYSQMLDVKTCLEFHGVTVAQPPTFETWRDQGTPWEMWTPYSDLWTIIPTQELRYLVEVCPPVGPTAVITDEQSWINTGLD